MGNIIKQIIFYELCNCNSNYNIQKEKKKKKCKVTYESGYVHLPNDCI